MSDRVQVFHLEDSKIAQKILKKILGEGVDICVAASKEEAITLINGEPEVSNFVVDYRLYDGNGIEFIEHVRKMSKYSEVPILFQSSNMTNSIAYKAMKVGANESITKLISANDLRMCVAGHIKKPHNVSVALENIEALCVIWSVGDTHYQYCPDINERVEGSSSVDAEDKMQEVLLNYIETAELQGVTTIDTFVHNIKVSN